MNYVLPVVCSLSVIVLVFLYIFMFRMPRSQINESLATELEALYADTSPSHERSTLLMRSREPNGGELMALVAWLQGYEAIDTTRELLPTAFDDYYEGRVPRLLWRETWPKTSYDVVSRASAISFEQKLTELQAQGWEIVFDLAFSQVDHILMLRRDRPTAASASPQESV